MQKCTRFLNCGEFKQYLILTLSSIVFDDEILTDEILWSPYHVSIKDVTSSKSFAKHLLVHGSVSKRDSFQQNIKNKCHKKLIKIVFQKDICVFHFYLYNLWNSWWGNKFDLSTHFLLGSLFLGFQCPIVKLLQFFKNKGN